MKSAKRYKESNFSKCFKKYIVPIANENYQTREQYNSLVDKLQDITIYNYKLYPIGFVCPLCGAHYFNADEQDFYFSIFNSSGIKIERNRTDWFFRPWKKR